MLISTWNYPFPNDDLADISTGTISLAEITEDLLTAYQKAGLNIIFLSQDRLSGRNDVTWEKVNLRPGIRKNLLYEKNQDLKSLCGS